MIDLKASPGVDIVGNVPELATPDRSRRSDASAVILALGDDSEAVFATAVVREHAPEVPVFDRARHRRTEHGPFYRLVPISPFRKDKVVGKSAYHR